jgi:hypothetical protein
MMGKRLDLADREKEVVKSEMNRVELQIARERELQGARQIHETTLKDKEKQLIHNHQTKIRDMEEMMIMAQSKQLWDLEQKIKNDRDVQTVTFDDQMKKIREAKGRDDDLGLSGPDNTDRRIYEREKAMERQLDIECDDQVESLETKLQEIRNALRPGNLDRWAFERYRKIMDDGDPGTTNISSPSRPPISKKHTMVRPPTPKKPFLQSQEYKETRSPVNLPKVSRHPTHQQHHPTPTRPSKSRPKPTPPNKHSQNLSTDFMIAALDESLMVNNHINKELDSNLFKSNENDETLFLDTKDSFNKEAQKIEKENSRLREEIKKKLDEELRIRQLEALKAAKEME